MVAVGCEFSDIWLVALAADAEKENFEVAASTEARSVASHRAVVK
jgi:hypothetical protein